MTCPIICRLASSAEARIKEDMSRSLTSHQVMMIVYEWFVPVPCSAYWSLFSSYFVPFRARDLLSVPDPFLFKFIYFFLANSMFWSSWFPDSSCRPEVPGPVSVPAIPRFTGLLFSAAFLFLFAFFRSSFCSWYSFCPWSPRALVFPIPLPVTWPHASF